MRHDLMVGTQYRIFSHGLAAQPRLQGWALAGTQGSEDGGGSCSIKKENIEVKGLKQCSLRLWNHWISQACVRLPINIALSGTCLRAPQDFSSGMPSTRWKHSLPADSPIHVVFMESWSHIQWYEYTSYVQTWRYQALKSFTGVRCQSSSLEDNCRISTSLYKPRWTTVLSTRDPEVVNGALGFAELQGSKQLFAQPLSGMSVLQLWHHFP